MNIEKERFALAESELAKYHGSADLKINTGLPSFEISRVGGKTLISAPDALELLYGVYDYAERYLGWYFFEPGKERFRKENIAVDMPDGIMVKAREPLLSNRGFIQEFAFDEETPSLLDWMAKNKLNYLQTWMKYYDNLSPELKHMARVRGIEIESGHHNFDYWIPGAKYGKTHPDFFAVINGSRISPSGSKNEAYLLSEQLCTSNPALRAEMTKNILEYCESHPEICTVAVIPNDGFGWCECNKCSTFYDKNEMGDDYSISRHVYKADRIYHDLVNDIAARVSKVRPDINIAFCAYINYCSPSKGFSLKKGMMVHLALYWHCINHLISDLECPVNSHYAQDIRNWAAVKNGGMLNIYEYYMGVNFYLSLPMIHFEEMFCELKWYSANGVDGILTQFHISHWNVYGMNYCMMARAARGESSAAIRNMFERLFGKNAEAGAEFFATVKRMLAGIGKCHIPYPYSLLDRTNPDDYIRLHSLAVALRSQNPNDSFSTELVIWTDYMIRFKKLFDAMKSGSATVEDVDSLLEWIHSYRNTRLFVHDKFDHFFKEMSNCIRDGKQWIHFNINCENEYILRHSKKWKSVTHFRMN